MMRPTRSAAVGLAAAVGLTMAVIPGVVSAVGEQVPFVSTLTLNTRATPQLTLEGTEFTQGLTTQPGSKNECNLATDSSLIKFTGLLGATTPQDVGFKGNSLGVNERIASVCNRVDNLSGSSQPETLQLELTSGLEVVPGSPVLGALSASLDIEVTSITKFFRTEKAIVEAQAFMGASTTPVGSWTLVQGTGTTAGYTYCSVANGANCRLEIDPAGDATFTRLTLKAKAGAFSLEGGSDEATPATATTPATYVPPTTIELVTNVDKVFPCVPGTDLKDNNATVTYVGTVNPNECAEFGATLTATDTVVQFLKPLAVAPTAQFDVEVEWKLPGTTTPSATLPPAFIDFEVGDAEREMGFCPPSVVETQGRLSTTAAGLAGFDDYAPTGLIGKQFACIFTRSAPTVSQTEVIITDRVFLIGDAKMSIR